MKITQKFKQSNMKRSREGKDTTVSRDSKKRRQDTTKADFLGYTNDDNPFNDERLTDKFVWKKKGDREQPKREEDIRAELLKAKERRLQREEEKRKEEEERDRLARERERSTYVEWEKKEEEFHLKQAKLRSDIRLKEGRAKPIDLIAKNLKLLDVDREKENAYEDAVLTVDNIDIEMREPYMIFEGLSLKDLEELRSDITTYLDLDKNMKGFWNALLIVCDDELKKAKAREEAKMSGVHSKGYTINPAVRATVDQIFLGKSHKELQDLEEEISQKTTNPDPYTDVEYWSELLKELGVFKAKALLREFHVFLLEKHLKHLEKDQGARAAVVQPKRSNENPRTTETTSTSPLSISDSDIPSDRKVFTEEEMMNVAQIDYEEGDDEFADEIELDKKKYSWDDKYRPRKPKYFNRVHTGYEWTNYNRVHYDSDKPPPKTIQGYKFNIFYPDLIDKSSTPKWFLEPGKTPDTCIIRFHAGPPYEDIAFKIVNREWERSHRRGYRCTFERGILHLYFKFKKFKYRR